MKPTQDEMEALFSQRNIHDVLQRSIAYQFNHVLLDAALGFFVRIEDYLNGDYYESKNTRIATLREFIDANSLDRIVIALIAAVIHAKRDQTIQAVIGYLQPYLPHDDHFDRAKTAGELIAVCSGPNRLFSIERPDNMESPLVVVNYWDILYDTFETEFEFIDDTFFNPPLVQKPKKVTNRHSCGYHTFNEPVILGRNTQHEDNLDFTALNILNQIPWVLDPHVLAIDEQPPTDIDDMPREEYINFRNHAHTARRIYNVLGSDPFHMVWQPDSRGRLYCHGHHVNLQSYEYKKAMLNFDHYEVFTT